ncbi:NlpC/P60 family protein [Clostridium scatologenes]|uniref:NlpC/P60 family protein n=1 Tax=Clostridium scatologenes TaxID=1548 RepID=A0A0E3JXF8_CLOSL|nr:C40 family peptidase [Clostridium scatologenes]AKA68124.1 NlpC/P60 family protein [Clostridium scatologenes]
MLNKILKKIIAAGVLTLITSSPVMAEPSSTNGSNSKQQVESIEMNIEKLDNQIEETMSKVDKSSKEILKVQNDIESVFSELDKSKNDMKNFQDLFNKRMRAIYISGSNGYVDMLIEADSFGDFLSRIDTVKRIISFDNRIISKYKAKQVDIAKKKDKLTDENSRLFALKSDNEKKLNQLNSEKSNQKKLLEEAKKQEKLYANTEQAQVSTAVKQVSDIRSAAPRLSRGTTTTTNASSNNVIAYASNFLGTPYVWGGTSPSPGFDCSGFTQYVYAHFGVSLGRTTYDQINDGSEVSRDQLQPGDLVFFGTRSNPHHMGIYVGNGAYIHAPHTGDVIKISPMSRNDYITARRVN